jgi:pimeloyl-ACP methyl ester carboxylesterase
VTLPALVLIHGGGHAADCWDLTIDELRLREPELRVLAVDLPGRRSRPADVSTVTIADCVDSVIADVAAAGLEDVVVVGHSMAGLIVPGVVGRLGHPRVRELILLAAFIPPEGSSVVESLRGPLAPLARIGASVRRPFPMPIALARFAFWNGMSVDQIRYATSRLYQDSVRVITEPADRTRLPGEVPRTWVLTTRDRALSPRRQRTYIDALGGVETVVPVDTCHDIMFSEPARLAAILADRCRHRANGCGRGVV